MEISAIPPLRLRSQGLAQAPFTRPEAVVDWLVAVQSQDYYMAQWSLGARMANAREAQIEQAFNEGAILRTHVLRPTWHFVRPADIRWLLALTARRVEQINATIYRQQGLDPATLGRGLEAIGQALLGGRQLTREQLGAAMSQAGIPGVAGLRLIYLVMHAELQGLICSGARRGKQFTYALIEERAPESASRRPDDPLAELARRYISSRGPATEYDFAKWSGLTVTDARQGLQANRPALAQVELDGQPYWLDPAVWEAMPEAATPRAYLLSVFDEYVSGYKDQGPTTTPDIRARLIGLGNGLRNIIVLDGQVVGAWKRSLSKAGVALEFDLYTKPSAAQEPAIRQAAERYAAFLETSLL